MRQFEIQVKSVKDVLAFVSLATKRSFSITVGTEQHQVNGKSFMEMFSLNISQPQTAVFECGEAERSIFLGEMARFRI